MGFSSWTKGLLGGGQRALGEEEVKGLNFRSVIGAHMKWRGRLADVINGKSTERLSASRVWADDECTLGKWLKEPDIQKEYGNNPEFQALMREHVRFHRCAALVLQRAQSGRKAEAQRLLDHGEFPQLSVSVCTRLSRLYRSITDNEMAFEAEERDDETTDRLDFRSVVNAHLLWRKQLVDVIKGSAAERLSVAQISAADRCVLGRWLLGPIRDDYVNSPEFQALVNEHTRFHKCAGQALQEAQSGRKQKALRMLNGVEFAVLSRSLCNRLENLHQASRNG